MDGAGSMEDIDEPMDLCAKHQWAAYKAAEKIGGIELGAKVHDEMLRLRKAQKAKREEALKALPPTIE